MAQTVTLATLVATTFDRADMPSDGTGPVTVAQCIQRVNAAVRIVHAELLKVRGDEYFAKCATLTTTSGTSTIALPTDFLKVSPEGVRWITGAGINLRIRRYQSNESQLQITGEGWTYHPNGANLSYRIRGSQIRFVPTPLGTYSVLFNYITTPPVLSDIDADTWDGYQGMEEAVTWHAAAACLDKQKADSSFCRGQFSYWMDLIRTQAPRDENEPPVVQWCDPGGSAWED